jgi:PAS domain S-box-containing protein
MLDRNGEPGLEANRGSDSSPLDSRQREAEFRAVFEGAAIGIALVDQRGRPVKCNPALQRMLGYTEAELCAMTFPEFTHPEDLTADLAQYERIVSGEISHYQLEKRFVRKDRRIVWGRLTVSLVRLEQGKPLYAIGMVEDVTDRKELEESLQEAQRWEATSQQEFARELLNAAEQERRTLGSELHDTLGQDLSIITNRVHQALAQPGLSAAVLDHLTAISQAASSAIGEVRRLVRDLRPWQIEEGGFTDSIRALVNRTAETALAQIDIRIDDVDREIKGRTAIHLYRIVQESLNNLVKHSKADRARFTLERDIKCIRLCLWDNGTGFEMNPESRPRGLGLTSILERSQMIGATADIQSAPGAGARITIVLPLRWD